MAWIARDKNKSLFYMTTDRQKRAVHFCEKVLEIKFIGDINDYNLVSRFLSKNLKLAKETYFGVLDLCEEECDATEADIY